MFPKDKVDDPKSVPYERYFLKAKKWPHEDV